MSYKEAKPKRDQSALYEYVGNGNSGYVASNTSLSILLLLLLLLLLLSLLHYFCIFHVLMSSRSDLVRDAHKAHNNNNNNNPI
jgi:hypothetical protein